MQSNNTSAQQQSATDETDSWDAGDSTWGAADNIWGVSSSQGNQAEQQSQDAFDFSDLESALSNVQQQATAQASKQQQHIISKPSQGHHQQQPQQQQQQRPSCTISTVTPPASVPGFYLHMSSEAAGASDSMSAEDQQIGTLVAAYQDEIRQVHIACPHA